MTSFNGRGVSSNFPAKNMHTVAMVYETGGPDVDILFDGQTHKIKKFVLHTNYPGHADFNSYMKCNFVIYNPDSERNQPEADPSKHKITPSTKWDQVKVICEIADVEKVLQNEVDMDD
ncbi:hypothetical protein POM88_035642 [Heracleum sosnowskyi]|uniref:Uncharacterized protein n=1 Tax=Heracleum sosnowskyi TaxID=360622 RepID=A0AAD8HNW3_9APIA|nr:hypothetical protein POM88_035642 [Heracleum sosnowskyi]